MLEKRVVYEIPGMQAITKRSIVYDSEDSVPLTMDIYSPPALAADAQLPAVIFVFGYPDSVCLDRYGMKLKDAGQYVSWAQLTAASGFMAITYETAQPEKDILLVLEHIHNNAEALHIDNNRIAIWSCSGNVPTALSGLIHASTALRCAVLYYGVMFDWDDSHEIAKMAARSGFVYPSVGKPFDHLSPQTSLFTVRAGLDDPKLNTSVEYFVSESIRRNLPLTFVNYSEGEHAFDIQDNSMASQEIIKHTLAFLHEHLLNE